MLIFVSNNLIICNLPVRDRPCVVELFPFLSVVTLSFNFFSIFFCTHSKGVLVSNYEKHRKYKDDPLQVNGAYTSNF